MQNKLANGIFAGYIFGHKNIHKLNLIMQYCAAAVSWLKVIGLLLFQLLAAAFSLFIRGDDDHILSPCLYILFLLLFVYNMVN
jgi:hypothetical protein